MKASKFSDAQNAFILKQGADGIPVAEICRRAGISHGAIGHKVPVSLLNPDGATSPPAVQRMRPEQKRYRL